MTPEPTGERLHGPIAERSVAGLTATELLVVSAILVFLVGMIHQTMRYQSIANRRYTADAVTQGTLRLWTERIVRDLRHTGFDPLPDDDVFFGFLTADSRTFRSSIDAAPFGSYDPSSARENLGYRIAAPNLQGFGTLERWHGQGSWRPVLERVSLAFRYYDSRGLELGTGGNPIPTRAIRRVDVTLSAISETGGGPGVAPRRITESSSAKIRNSSNT